MCARTARSGLRHWLRGKSSRPDQTDLLPCPGPPLLRQGPGPRFCPDQLEGSRRRTPSPKAACQPRAFTAAVSVNVKSVTPRTSIRLGGAHVARAPVAMLATLGAEDAGAETLPGPCVLQGVVPAAVGLARRVVMGSPNQRRAAGAGRPARRATVVNWRVRTRWSRGPAGAPRDRRPPGRPGVR